MSEPIATVTVIAPPVSSGRARSPGTSGSIRRAAGSSTAMSGMFTRKIDRQPRYCVSTPPATIPLTPPAAVAAVHRPSARVRAGPSA